MMSSKGFTKIIIKSMPLKILVCVFVEILAVIISNIILLIFRHMCLSYKRILYGFLGYAYIIVCLLGLYDVLVVFDMICFGQ